MGMRSLSWSFYVEFNPEILFNIGTKKHRISSFTLLMLESWSYKLNHPQFFFYLVKIIVNGCKIETLTQFEAKLSNNP